MALTSASLIDHDTHGSITDRVFQSIRITYRSTFSLSLFSGKRCGNNSGPRAELACKSEAIPSTRDQHQRSPQLSSYKP